MAVGGNLYLENPQNTVGHALSPVGALGANLGEIYVQGICSKQSRTPPPACGWGAVDDVWGNTTGSVIPNGFITVPSLTCCSPYLGSTGHPELSARPERHGLLVPQRLDRAKLTLRDVERRVPEVRPTRACD